MKKEYDLKKMKVKKNGSIIDKDTKVSKTIRIDIDILEWLLTEADRKGIGYQTLISMILRDSMTINKGIFSDEWRKEIRKIIKEEIKKAS